MATALRTYGRTVLRTRFCDNSWTIKEIRRGVGGRRLSRGLGKSKLETDSDSVTPFGGYLFKPFIFTTATTYCAFSGAAIFKYEDLRKAAKEFSNSFPSNFKEKVTSIIQRERKSNKWRDWMNKTWNSVSVGEKMVLGCIFMNLCVFLGWKRTNPATIQFMERYFTASPFGKSPCASMFLSIFSHRSFLHLACNMTCLWSFASTAVEAVGKEQAAALYVSAGMTSSLLSYVWNVMRSSRTSSVGASGAILGLVGAVCTLFPDYQLIIIFLPMFPILAKYAVKGIIAVDLAGVALKWKFFDHAGHLGGTLCGVGFISYGQEFVLKYQKELVNVWHEFRE